MSDYDDDSSKLGVGILGLLLLPITMPWHGFVGSKLWAWFVVPLGAAPVGIANFIGLALLVNMVTFRYRKRTTEEDYGALALGVVGPAMTLGVAAIVKAFL